MYNYLFYKSYKLGLRLKNWNDNPLLFAIGVVGFIAIMNIATITMITDKLITTNISESFSMINEYKYIVAIIILGMLIFYYRFNNRWRRIISGYEEKEQKNSKVIHPAIPVLIIFAASF